MNHTVQVVKNIQKINIASAHTPLSVATGAILLIAEMNNLPITKKMIAKKFEVSEVTITKAYKKLCEYKKIILNNQLTDLCVTKMEEQKKAIQMPKELADKFSKMGFNTSKYIQNPIKVEDDPIEYGTIDLNNIDEQYLDDFIDSINLDIYELVSNTDSEYNDIIQEISYTIKT